MKREIVCTECNEKYASLFHAGVPYPFEHIKNIQGSARQSFRCDFCGDKINRGGICHAVSKWADYGGMPYHEWEQDFVTTNQAADVQS